MRCPRIFGFGRARTKGGRAERAEVPGYDSPGAHGGRRRWKWEEVRGEEKSFRREHERRGEEWIRAERAEKDFSHRMWPVSPLRVEFGSSQRDIKDR